MIIANLAILVFLLLVSSGLGIQISNRLGVSYSSRLESVAFSIGLGLSCFIGMGFALASVGGLNQWNVLLGLGFMTAISLASLRKATRLIVISDGARTESDIRVLGYAGLSFLFLLVAINLIGALSPEVIWDAHSLHLDMPKRWISAGGFIYVPYMPYSNWPLNLSVIYAVEMLLIDGSTLPQLTHFSLGVLSALLIYCFARSRYGFTSAVFASIIFYSVPVMTWLSGTAISDLGACYFTLFAIFAFLRWAKSDAPGWLMMSAIGTGLAMGTKLIGLFGLALLVLSILGKGLLKKERLLDSVFRVIQTSIVALGLALPWYLKSYLQAGNPIFPFGYELFGGRYWTASVNARFLASQFAFMGIGRSIADYALLPFRLLVPEHIPYEGPVSWVFLAAAVWGLAQFRDKTVTYLSCYAALSFLPWALFTTQQVRMLLPTLGILGVVAGAAVMSATQRLNRSATKWLLAFLLVGLIVEGVAGVARERSGSLKDQIAVIVNRQSREDYLRARFPLADALLFIDQKLPPDGAILAFNEVRGYRSQREFILGHPYLQAYIDYEQLKTREALKRRLTETGVKYVLINNVHYPSSARELEPIRADLQLIYNQGEIRIYELVPGDSIR